MLNKLNSPVMYLICGTIILFVACVCVFFMIRAYRAGIAIGMDKRKLKTTITSSATFAILPSVGILLGVIALSGALGTPLPWLRLSVIGALHYETQVASAAAESVGMSGLNAAEMTPTAFTTIALLMSACIMWGMVFSTLLNKRYLRKISGKSAKNSAKVSGVSDASESSSSASEATGSSSRTGGGFGDMAMTAMFIGLVSAYIGSYIGGFISGNGKFAFAGSLMPLVVVLVSGIVMAVFIKLQERGHAWVESFSIAGSMMVGMIAAALLGGIIQ